MLNNRDTNDSMHIVAAFHSPSGTEHIAQSNLKLKTTENYVFVHVRVRGDHAAHQTIISAVVIRIGRIA
jgi:hypothetical protein